MDSKKQLETVSHYYGQTLTSSADLKTSACCPIDSMPLSHQKILQKLHPQVKSTFYGCGSPIPHFLKGSTVLDLGCGTGRDVYLASALVGKNGSVIGIDMTRNQLQIAKEYQQYHAKIFFDDPNSTNVDFRHGYIENLKDAGMQDNSIDVVISNCVCNLSPDKSAVFSEVARVLKQGGEFYFSDVYADRRLSTEARKHPVLVAECLGGALYIEDFRRIMSSVGLNDIRIVSIAPIELNDEQLLPLVKDVTFYSITIRAFKIQDLQDRREDYQQTATFTSCCDSSFKLDTDFIFEKGVATPVDSNTAAILSGSRFHKNFNVTPPVSHRGLFTMDLKYLPGDSLLNSFRSAKKESMCAKQKSNYQNGSTCSPSDVVTDVTNANISNGSKPSTKQSCCAPNNRDSATNGGSCC